MKPMRAPRYKNKEKGVEALRISTGASRRSLRKASEGDGLLLYYAIGADRPTSPYSFYLESEWIQNRSGNCVLKPPSQQTVGSSSSRKPSES